MRLAALTPLAAAVLAACGGEGDDGDADDSPPATAEGEAPGGRGLGPGGLEDLDPEQQDALEALRECLSEQGVDPSRPGEGGGPSPEQLEALEACRDELPEGFAPPGG